MQMQAMTFHQGLSRLGGPAISAYRAGSSAASALTQFVVSHRWVYDTAAAVVTVAASLTEMHANRRAPGQAFLHHDLAGILLVAAAGAALTVQRFRPATAILVTGTVAIALSALGYVAARPVQLLGVNGPALGPVLALYAFALRRGRARSVPVLIAAIVAGTAGQIATIPGPVLPVVIGTVIVLLVAWGMGDARRGRHLHLESVKARADRLSRERHVLAEMAVSQERSRIARELHDVVAHHVSLMIVTAGAADRQLRRNPETAHRIIEDLIGTGRSAVIEMRRMLGVLRSDDQQADAIADLRPQPTLAELHTLIATFADAGLAVELTISGQSRSLPAGVELTAYRILQESLTNTLRHAGAGTDVHVRVRYRADSLFLEVTDHGVQPPAGPPAEPGHGLIGMRERVTLLGGHLDAAPVPEGGFGVRATLPLAGDHLAQRHLV